MIPPIAIPIRPKSAAEGIKLSKKTASLGATFCELWCDGLSLSEAQAVVNASPIPVIITLKGVSQNGTFTGTPEAYEHFMRDIDQLDNVAYLDIDYSFLYKEFLASLTKPIIASYHNFIGTEKFKSLNYIFESMAKLNPAIIKIATKVDSESDLITLMQVQMRKIPWRHKIIFVGMGKKGKALRIMSPLLNQAIVFAALSEASKTAPGQVTIKKLKAEWERIGFMEGAGE